MKRAARLHANLPGYSLSCSAILTMALSTVDRLTAFRNGCLHRRRVLDPTTHP